MFYSATTKGVYSEKHHGENIPADALPIPDLLYQSYLNAEISRFDVIDGVVVAYKRAEPTPEEFTAQEFESVRAKLQSEIDAKAKALGFSGGNALMLYAGFSNGFQTLAQAFAQWEADVWIQAGAYKDEVLAGTKPMLTPDEAVAMMPELVLPA
ncbi:hypothetical protein C3Y98_04715 [Methylotenera oryzisoli]|uniref:Uncharacterized protein n=1 Tax=Methylotenera oryzisoli TaxID=2080758 RepID=A0A4Y9VS45_9PROT|nr:hypothetical protein [Methylotenera oryzisoli]TFW71411.1 hypothetical protein C3Y98_04715 [Methylotenera oryzisoli]